MNPSGTVKSATCISKVVGCAVCVSPSARGPEIERGDSLRVVLNLHRRHNASLLSPSRTRWVSPAVGERSGEGSSKPFKCRWFSTSPSSIPFPSASQHASPTGAAHHSEGLLSLSEAALPLISPPRTRWVSPAVGERSGEGSSKPFKCRWFSTSPSSIPFPSASQHASPNGAAHHSEGLPSLSEATLVQAAPLRTANPAPPFPTAPSSSVPTPLRRIPRPRSRPALVSPGVNHSSFVILHSSFFTP